MSGLFFYEGNVREGTAWGGTVRMGVLSGENCPGGEFTGHRVTFNL